MKIALLKLNPTQWVVAAGLAVGLGSATINAQSVDEVTNYVRHELSRRGDSKYQELLGAYESQLRNINTFIEDFLDSSLDGSANAFIGRLNEDMETFRNVVIERMRGDGNIANVLEKIEYLYGQFNELKDLIHANKDVKSPYVLAPQLLRFRHLIPNDIQARYGANDVLQGLKHRLRSKGSRTRRFNQMAIAAAATRVRGG